MESNGGDGAHLNLDNTLENEANQYAPCHPRGKNVKQVTCEKNEELNKKRFPVCRTGNNPGRVKRVVSCKRKTHHLMVTRRRQHDSWRAYDASNKENEMSSKQDIQQEIFEMVPWEYTLNIHRNHMTGTIDSEQTEHWTLNELNCNHSTMVEVLFGRNLRLKVAFTLWQRNMGELLTYFLRIKDTATVVDFLPLIGKGIDDNSQRVTIGCCVDLFPLVKEVLSNPYEEYILVGLKWIHSVLKNWREELAATGYSGSTNLQMDNDRNFQHFKQQLLEFWHQEPVFKSLPGPTGDIAKIIDSVLCGLP